jgi:hypothetical protein
MLTAQIHMRSAVGTPAEEAESRAALDLVYKIEEDYHNEDEQQLIRLIKIRRSLWT